MKSGSDIPTEPRLIGFLYGFTVFASSAMLLVLEITAGRLLAPYIGVSLYTWTSIIGVILAGLSLGNWLGGVLAERGCEHRTTGVILILSAVMSALILPLIALFAAQIQGLRIGLAPAGILYVLGLFFVPSVLIGAVTPLVTTLYLNRDDRTGKIVGRMHALSALGSILGTFAAGLLLVQWIGTRNIILLVSLVLFILAAPFFLTPRIRTTQIVAGAALYIAAGLISLNSIGYSNPCDAESNYYCLRVVEEPIPSSGRQARTLVLDHMIHSTNVADKPEMLVTPYVQIMDRLVDQHFRDRETLNYFFAGGGAYTHPRAIAARFPQAGITVSEIDPAVTKIAEEQLFLDPGNMRIFDDDTRNVLRDIEPGKFDVAVLDVFHDVAIPWHLTTLEHARLVKSRLTRDGLFLANVIDVFPENRLILSMVATLKELYPHVGVWVQPPDGESTRLTYVISGSERQSSLDTIQIALPTPQNWFQIVDFIDQQIDKYNAPVLTDDFAPIERLLGPLLTAPVGS